MKASTGLLRKATLDNPVWSSLEVKGILVECVVPEKNTYPPHGRSSEIPRGRGVSKAKILDAKYEAKPEFPGGRGDAKQKNLPWGSMNIYWSFTFSLNCQPL